MKNSDKAISMKIGSLADSDQAGTIIESFIVRQKSCYTLAQLLAEHEGDIPRLTEWEAMPPVGLETEGF